MRNTLSIQARAEKRRRTVVALAIGCLAFVTIVLNFFLGDMGFVQYRKYLQSEQELQQQLEETRNRNLALGSEVGALESDKESIERLARESLDMMRDGEVVYKFRKE